MTITILLATYNGARYLPEQIASLQAQTYRDWTLVVRDDHSTDGTPYLLAAAARSDRRIRVLPGGEDRLGVVGNFGELLLAAELAGAPYVAFCDQDDVWQPEKLAKLLAATQAAEDEHGTDIPIVTCGDLAVVDADLNVQAESFWAHTRLGPPTDKPLAALLVQNFAPGCSMLLNRTAASWCHPMPCDVFMHDWWALLGAASIGRIVAVHEPLTLYRQHGRNQVGATGFWQKLNPLRTNWLDLWRRGSKSFGSLVCQARRLRNRLVERGDLPACKERDTLGRFCRAFDRGPLTRTALLWRHDFPSTVHPLRRYTFLARSLVTSIKTK